MAKTARKRSLGKLAKNEGLDTIRQRDAIFPWGWDNARKITETFFVRLSSGSGRFLLFKVLDVRDLCYLSWKTIRQIEVMTIHWHFRCILISCQVPNYNTHLAMCTYHSIYSSIIERRRMDAPAAHCAELLAPNYTLKYPKKQDIAKGNWFSSHCRRGCYQNKICVVAIFWFSVEFKLEYLY